MRLGPEAAVVAGSGSGHCPCEPGLEGHLRCRERGAGEAIVTGEAPRGDQEKQG